MKTLWVGWIGLVVLVGFLGASSLAHSAGAKNGLHGQAEVLYRSLRGKAKTYGRTWKAKQLKGERGDTWNYGFGFTSPRKFAFPPKVTSIKGRKIAVGAGVKTHAYYAGQLGYSYSIQRRGRSLIVRESSRGFNPGATFYISPTETRVAGVTHPEPSRFNLYPHSYQNDQRHKATPSQLKVLAEILGTMGTYVGE